MSDLYDANLRIIRQENRSRIFNLMSSLNALKDPESDYAKIHRKLIELCKEINKVIDRYS